MAMIRQNDPAVMVNKLVEDQDSKPQTVVPLNHGVIAQSETVAQPPTPKGYAI